MTQSARLNTWTTRRDLYRRLHRPWVAIRNLMAAAGLNSVRTFRRRTWQLEISGRSSAHVSELLPEYGHVAGIRINSRIIAESLTDLEERTPEVLLAMLTLEESSRLRSGAGWAAPPVFQQKPGMQLFFFRKTSPSVPEDCKAARLFFNKSLVCSFSSFEKTDHGCSAFADWLRPIPKCGTLTVLSERWEFAAADFSNTT